MRVLDISLRKLEIVKSKVCTLETLVINSYQQCDLLSSPRYKWVKVQMMMMMVWQSLFVEYANTDIKNMLKHTGKCYRNPFMSRTKPMKIARGQLEEKIYILRTVWQ